MFEREGVLSVEPVFEVTMYELIKLSNPEVWSKLGPVLVKFPEFIASPPPRCQPVDVYPH